MSMMYLGSGKKIFVHQNLCLSTSIYLFLYLCILFVYFFMYLRGQVKVNGVFLFR